MKKFIILLILSIYVSIGYGNTENKKLNIDTTACYDDSREEKMVIKTLEPSVKRIQKIYYRILRDYPDLYGDAVCTIVIEANGKVIVEDIQASFNNKAMEYMMIYVLTQVRFPRASDELTVTIPFKFHKPNP